MMCKGAPQGSWGLVYRGLVQQVLEMGISLHMAPFLRITGVLFTWNSER